MKIAWKKNEDAVSPVIATILMVAITVVLAAVLYVMVIGFGGGGGSTPAGSWTDVAALNSTAAKLTFGAFTTDVQPIDVKIFVSSGGTQLGSITFPNNQATTLTWVPATGGPALTVTYFDYNSAGGLVNSGDYVTLNVLTTGTPYSVEVFHIPTEATVAMTGDSGTWTQP